MLIKVSSSENMLPQNLGIGRKSISSMRQQLEEAKKRNNAYLKSNRLQSASKDYILNINEDLKELGDLDVGKSPHKKALPSSGSSFNKITPKGKVQGMSPILQVNISLRSGSE